MARHRAINNQIKLRQWVIILPSQMVINGGADDDCHESTFMKRRYRHVDAHFNIRN